MKRYINAASATSNQQLFATCAAVCNYLDELTNLPEYDSAVIDEYNDAALDSKRVALMFFLDTANDIEYSEDRLSIEIRSFAEETLYAIDLYGKSIFDVVAVYNAAAALYEYYLTKYQVFIYNSAHDCIQTSPIFDDFGAVRDYVELQPLSDGEYYRVSRYLYNGRDWEYEDDCTAKLKFPNAFEPKDLRVEFRGN